MLIIQSFYWFSVVTYFYLIVAGIEWFFKFNPNSFECPCTSLFQMSDHSQVVQPDIWECCVASRHSTTSSFCPDEAADISHHSAYYAFKLERPDRAPLPSPQPLFFRRFFHIKSHSYTHKLVLLPEKSHRSANSKVLLLLTLAHAW